MTSAATADLSGLFVQAIAYQGNESLSAELQDIAGNKAKAAAIADSLLLDFVENTLSNAEHNADKYAQFLFLKALRNHLVMLIL